MCVSYLTQLCSALLTFLTGAYRRQLVVGGSREQLRAVHSALQSGLTESSYAEHALPLLECTLVCLEAAGSGRSPQGFASQVTIPKR